MTRLDHRELTLIKRAAEDAIHACNRHYGPFVDVVAHPLNIIALVEMAQSHQSVQSEMVRLKVNIGQATNDLVRFMEEGCGEDFERLKGAVLQTCRRLESLRGVNK
ncbi:hypothetical protein I5735_03805 [Acinetobacter baumannii]|nr:hypothetical protein [Acinetobacter baumannii]